MISLVRVDNRLIHGQVVEAWLPHLKVARVVVVDDEAAQSPLIRAAMGLAVPSSVRVSLLKVGDADFSELAADSEKTLLLVKDLASLTAAVQRGLKLSQVNLGNVHFGTGKKQVSPSVFLSPDEMESLKRMKEEGAQVEARAVPSDRPIDLSEMQNRFERA